MSELDNLRQKIDNIDKEILLLFTQRMEIAKGVAEYKKVNNLPVLQGNRENEVIQNVVNAAEEGMGNGVKALFTNIMDISKCLQQGEIGNNKIDFKPYTPENNTFAVQGTCGSNSENAFKQIAPGAVAKFYTSFEEVFTAVEEGDVAYGILPIDNTITGSVYQTYDLLAKSNCYIVKNTQVEIKHVLCAKKLLKLENIKAVYSHPQALAQCSEFLKANNLKPVQASNTATAAEFVSNSDENIAAICSPEAAKQFNLIPLNENITNYSCNFTSFIAIAKDIQLDQKDTQFVSVVIVLEHKPGSLYRLMTKLFVYNVNIVKLESRPLADGSFNYKFYIDFQGDIRSQETLALLAEIKAHALYFKFLGVY
jgi:chorismate mutase/prephenate dehydratase